METNTQNEIDYIDYMNMLADNDVVWKFQSEMEETLEHMKYLAKLNNLDIEEYRNKNKKMYPV